MAEEQEIAVGGRGRTTAQLGPWPTLSLLIYAGLPVLYFLSITVLRRGRQRDQEFADFT